MEDFAGPHELGGMETGEGIEELKWALAKRVRESRVVEVVEPVF